MGARADPKVAALAAAIAVLVAVGAAIMAYDGELEDLAGQASMVLGWQAPPVMQSPPAMQAYSLPLDVSRIENWDLLGPALSGGGVRAGLEKNGFAIVQNPYNLSRIVGAYDLLNGMGVDPLVTTDAVLHLSYVQFSQTWPKIEGRFFSDLHYISRKMMDGSLEQYESLGDPVLREAALSNAALFAVAQKVSGVEQQYELPGKISGAVEEEAALIRAGAEARESPVLGYDIDCQICGKRQQVLLGQVP